MRSFLFPDPPTTTEDIQSKQGKTMVPVPVPAKRKTFACTCNPIQFQFTSHLECRLRQSGTVVATPKSQRCRKPTTRMPRKKQRGSKPRATDGIDFSFRKIRNDSTRILTAKWRENAFIGYSVQFDPAEGSSS